MSEIACFLSTATFENFPSLSQMVGVRYIIVVNYVVIDKNTENGNSQMVSVPNL